MASEMIERAARAVYPIPNVGMSDARAIASAVIDAALDPEDAGLSLAIVRACIAATKKGGQTIHREVIAAIKAYAQGGPAGHE